jgi:hypothetical protein
MVDRRVLQIGAIVWAVIGFVLAVVGFVEVNPDARLLVGVASIAFPAAAVLAGFALSSRRERIAGLLLLISVATPTYFAYIVNLPALVVGLALLGVPKMTVRSQPPVVG